MWPLSYITASLKSPAQRTPPCLHHTAPRQSHFIYNSAATPPVPPDPPLCADSAGLHLHTGKEPTWVPSCAHSAPHHHFTTAHLGLYYWERLLELGGSALNSAAWATRLTAVMNVPRGHGLQTVSVEHLSYRLRIHPKIVLAPTDGAVEMPEGAHGRGNSLQ